MISARLNAALATCCLLLFACSPATTTTVPYGIPSARDSGAAASESPMFEATFVLTFEGASQVTNADYLFLVQPDTVVVVEPVLQDSPTQTMQKAILLTLPGEWKCKDKSNPASRPGTYYKLCARLISRAGNSFVLDEVFVDSGAAAFPGSDETYTSTVSVQVQGRVCHAQLVSYQRSFANSAGVFYRPSSIRRTSCVPSID